MRTTWLCSFWQKIWLLLTWLYYFVHCIDLSHTDGVAVGLPKTMTETGIDGGVALGPVPIPHDAMTHTDTRTASGAGVVHEATPPNTRQERTETERKVNDQRSHLLQNLTKRRQNHHRPSRAKRRRRRMALEREGRKSWQRRKRRSDRQMNCEPN